MTARCSTYSAMATVGFLICSLVSITLSLLYFTELRWLPDVSRCRHYVSSEFQNGDDEPTANNTKMIMFWTRAANTRNWLSFPENETTRFLASLTKCSRNCILTSDHSKFRQADMLLFYRSEKPDWPKRRYANQFYAHYTLEAPNWLHGSQYLHQYDGGINITINFRRDADFYFPYNLVLPVTSNAVYQPRIAHRNKTKMVVWPVSHCITESRREYYAHELSKYIDVEIYGACGRHKCSKAKHRPCMMQWEAEFMFYLSFENSICEDYITEKTFVPLQYEIIPVVLGGGNYSRDTPPHSVINARDFKSPNELANYLILLAADEQRYRSYFQWKTHYQIVGGIMLFLCR